MTEYQFEKKEPYACGESNLEKTKKKQIPTTESN